MNTRKNRLRSLFAGEGQAPDEAKTDKLVSDQAAEGPDTSGPDAQARGADSSPAEPVIRRSTSGAVKAMGLSLGNLSQEVQEARRLREALADGEVIIELDTAKIERSPFVDRLSEGARNDADFASLLESMKEHGQQVPVLVRPHPDAENAARGLYQIAYGHRRVQAARQLGLPIRAVVRKLDDTDLVLAQGKENAERRSLSFIERAFFAKALVDHGFDRATAQSALSVHKSEMSRLLQVAEMVPLHMVQAIGPAPKAGRPRWLALGELLENDAADIAEQEVSSDEFAAADSDTRFQRLFNRLEASARRRGKSEPKAVVEPIAGADGKAIGELIKAGKAARLTIADKAGRGFADYVARRLPELHEEFERHAGGKSAEPAPKTNHGG